jgi:hypothetical protein
MNRSLTSVQQSALSMKSLVSLAVFFALICFPRGVYAQTYGFDNNNTVTVTVATITNVAVSSGSVSLTMALANVTAGQDLMGPVTNTATSLLWGINSSLKKVTVKTSLVAPKYTLKLLAVSPTTGTAAPEVTLSTTAADFMINLGRSSGTCTLQYSGYALASTGVGSDSHTITFTIATQ